MFQLMINIKRKIIEMFNIGVIAILSQTIFEIFQKIPSPAMKILERHTQSLETLTMKIFSRTVEILPSFIRLSYIREINLQGVECDAVHGSFHLHLPNLKILKIEVCSDKCSKLFTHSQMMYLRKSLQLKLTRLKKFPATSATSLTKTPTLYTEKNLR